MKVVPLNSLFKVSYGNKFDFNKMKLATSSDQNRVNFVSRTESNNGVSGSVLPVLGTEPYEQGCITVALGGAILSSFVQVRSFYTAQNVAILEPLTPFNLPELIYYCKAIEHNRFRYGAFGREANRSLKTLLVPSLDSMPDWVLSAKQKDISKIRNVFTQISTPRIEPNKWLDFKLGGQEGLFIIKKGKRLTKENMKQGYTPFIGSTDSRNGVTAFIDKEPIHKGNTISVCYNGSVAEAFYQPKPFCATDDVNVLYPNFELNSHIALFLTTLIKREKYRYNYGRKWHLGRMEESTIKLPIDQTGRPDWQYMDNYVKSLPYSAAI